MVGSPSSAGRKDSVIRLALRKTVLVPWEEETKAEAQSEGSMVV